MNIAIVGGGASAVCVVDKLARSTHPSGELTVFDPSPHLWRGRAYQRDAEVVLVNSPAEDMSVREGDSGHYERWLAVHGHTAEFAPRTVYGDYLEFSAREGIARLRERGWQVTIVREAVAGVLRIGDQVVLHTNSGLHTPCDYIVLAVGGGHPRDAFGLAGKPNFVGEPYPVARTLSAIAPDDSVAVIGTGLTAVDVLIALHSRGHRGPITLLSRHGVLPAVRQQPISYQPKHFVPERLHAMAGRTGQVALADVIELLRLELAEACADLDEVWEEISCVRAEAPAARLRRQLADVGCRRIGVRVMQQAVHVCGPDLWPLLPESTRQHILGRHYRTLMSLCCPMPPSSATTILRLIDSGQLTVLSGVQRTVPSTVGGFRITTDSTELAVCHVVNAVNASAHRVPPGARRLVNALYAERLAMPHPDGGLCVDTATSRLVGTSLSNPGIYAIGDIAGGTFFFTFGVPSLVDRSHDIVTDILATEWNRMREGSCA
ncbi:FAD/NAD(P)-binding protein [Streptomyces sp. NPDC058371]|uniref:FAD/NAD(P)-binding protein n=1 Tax=Streptomyces sp. NPDC058371 TaxID=3346463 RepID=UPI003665BCE5